MRSSKSNIKRNRLRLSHRLDLITSRWLNIQEVESVCLTLGPYRNLTTLTAAILFLHPNCQVLNHAGTRVFATKSINFLLDFNKAKFDRFIQFAIRTSAKGQRGPWGGSVTHSHAFDSKHRIKKIFDETNSKLIKKQIKCLFWKESHRTSNLIHEKNIDIATILKKDHRLRFILPIRNPLDCAASNLKTGHIHLFPKLNKKSSPHDAVKAILDEIYWFANLKKQFPDRFHYYFEHEISQKTLIDLAQFLQLQPKQDWLTNALAAMEIKSAYEHDSELLNSYQNHILKYQSRFPELSKKLLIFIQR